MKTIAFFGHKHILDNRVIKEKLMNTLKEVTPQGFSRFLIGSHGDFDKLVLSTCLNYRKTIDNHIKINVVLTSLSFLNKDEYGFSKVDIYNNKNCETIFYDIEETHFKNRITVSNKKMVDESDLIICYVDMNIYKSGAKTTILYAIKQNKKIINLFNESIDLYN